LASAWASGAASAEIGQLVGVSASAVRGKRMRLGLPARSPLAVAIGNHERGLALSWAPVPSRALPPPPPPLAGSTPRPWLQRGPRECAWPVTAVSGETLSCCLPVEPGGPYCLGHQTILRGEPWPPVDPGNVTMFRSAP
jgi:hypothetical protein